MIDAAPHGDRDELKGIRQTAAELGVTERTLRFYEDEGLIQPERVGLTRVYGRREIARMQLILRGKRLGFSIRELREFLDLYAAGPDQLEQMRRLLERVRERIDELARQRAALDQTLAELTAIEAEARTRLASHLAT